MDSFFVLTSSSSTSFLHQGLGKLICYGGFSEKNRDFGFVPRNEYCSFSSQKLRPSISFRKSVTVAAKKKNYNKKNDTHSFVPKPDETTGLFPEAVLLKEKKVQEDGKLLPEFADDEEQELYEALNLLMESDMDVERMRHYEVVYLIHENYANEVESVNLKVEEFLREKKGKVWRFSDWGLRRLAYKIQKAKNAHYILMNFEVEAKWINDFKSMLDKDERVIRHLVIKRDKAITDECPPPLEFHTLRADMVDDEDDDFDGEDDEDYEDEGDEELDDENAMDNASFDVENEKGIIYIDDDVEDVREVSHPKKTGVSSGGRRGLKPEKVHR